MLKARAQVAEDLPREQDWVNLEESKYLEDGSVHFDSRKKEVQLCVMISL